jgi:aspartyl protease family protein
MRQLIFFAVALVVAGSYMARFADRAVEARPEPQAAVLEPANDLREPTTSGRSLMLESDRQGHFQVEARVEGRFVDFVVDTGASLVVLRESSAAARLPLYGRHRQRQDQGRAGEDRSYRSRRYHGL